MSRKRTAIPPSDEEILSYSNVPYKTAAAYIGMSDVTIRYALQDRTCPFGFSARNPQTGSYTYNISPGALVAYKHGKLPPMWSLNKFANILADNVQRVIDTRIEAAANVLKGASTQ